MWEDIKNWWERYQHGRRVRKLEMKYIAVLTLFQEGEWEKDDKFALKIYTRARTKFHQEYKDYYKKWGVRPNLENELLTDPIN